MLPMEWYLLNECYGLGNMVVYAVTGDLHYMAFYFLYATLFKMMREGMY